MHKSVKSKWIAALLYIVNAIGVWKWGLKAVKRGMSLKHRILGAWYTTKCCVAYTPLTISIVVATRYVPFQLCWSKVIASHHYFSFLQKIISINYKIKFYSCVTVSSFWRKMRKIKEEVQAESESEIPTSVRPVEVQQSMLH